MGALGRDKAAPGIIMGKQGREAKHRMAKTLCEIRKIKKQSTKSWNAGVLDATHVCRKCKRLAAAKKRLCKPEKLRGQS